MKIYLQFALTLTLIFGLTSNTNGQSHSKKEYKVSLTSGTVVISDINDLIIQGYDGNEIVFSTMVENLEQTERTAGLKLINNLGLDDNTGFGVSVSKEGNVVNAHQIGSECDCEEVKVMVPRGVNVSVSHGSHNANTINVKDISSEVEITTNYHDIFLENVTGPMAVKTIYGKIEGSFSALSQKGSISIYSVYDLVDLKIPSATKASLTISAPYGSVYSNADIEITNKSTKSPNSCSSGGNTIQGHLNGGGVDFTIKSAYEDVYLRQ